MNNQLLAENLNKWREPKSPKEIINFVFFAIQDAEDEEDDDDKKKDKDKDKKKDGKDGKGRARHMFSLFLNLRICLTKISLIVS